VLDPAFLAFNRTRKERLRTYPGVEATLANLYHSGHRIVAHTESRVFGGVDRLVRLNLIDFFSRIYCRSHPETHHPGEDDGTSWSKKIPFEKVKLMSLDKEKPNPQVVRDICAREG